MQEYNNTILNLIAEKKCTVCKVSKPKTEYNKKTGKCKECTSNLGKMKRLDSGKSVRLVDLFCLLPGFGFCPTCKQILENSLMNKRACKSCKAKADKASKEKIRERNKSRIIDYQSIKRCCPTCKIEKAGTDFAKSVSDVLGISKECKECKRKFDIQYRKENVDKILNVKRRCYSKKREYYNEKSKKWSIANPEKRKKIANDFALRKRLTKQGSIEVRWSASIKTCFKRNGVVSHKNWRKILGYGPKDLCEHLESQFEDGMTWELFMAGKIHIDHIIPKCSFFYENENDIEFKQCWDLKNLKPMWNFDNWAKNDLMPDGSGVRGRHVRKQKIKNLSELDDISCYGDICKITDEDTLS